MGISKEEKTPFVKFHKPTGSDFYPVVKQRVEEYFKKK